MEPIFLSHYEGEPVVVDFRGGSQRQGIFVRLRDDFYVFFQQGQEAETLRMAVRGEFLRRNSYDVLGYPKLARSKGMLEAGDKVVRVTKLPRLSWTNIRIPTLGDATEVTLSNGAHWRSMVQVLDPSGAVVLRWVSSVKPGEFWAQLEKAPEPTVQKTPEDRIAELESLVHNLKEQIEKYEKNQ